MSLKFSLLNVSSSNLVCLSIPLNKHYKATGYHIYYKITFQFSFSRELTGPSCILISHLKPWKPISTYFYPLNLANKFHMIFKRSHLPKSKRKLLWQLWIQIAFKDIYCTKAKFNQILRSLLRKKWENAGFADPYYPVFSHILRSAT